jgi:endo-1,4-beta-D-glucanase Y
MEKNYVEFSFYTCFYEIFIVENSSWETELDGTELLKILEFLDITIDRELIVENYLNRNNHSIEVFQSKADERVFVYFDLEKDPTDQNDMFLLGISCRKHDEEIIHEKLLTIHRKLHTKSPITLDFENHELFNGAFRPYSQYFDGNYLPTKRQINHYTL